MKVINTYRISMFAEAMLITFAIGCSDDRVAQVATQAADRQAEQNDTMAKLQQDVAGGSKQLVEADANARHEIVAVHHDLQAERTRLDTGWTALEDERKQLAGARRTESLWVPVVQSLGGLFLVIALLGFSWYALVKLRTDTATDAELSELLVHELAAGTPFNFPGKESPAQITYDGNRPSAGG
jgi:hypothetical protein